MAQDEHANVIDGMYGKSLECPDTFLKQTAAAVHTYSAHEHRVMRVFFYTPYISGGIFFFSSKERERALGKSRERPDTFSSERRILRRATVAQDEHAIVIDGMFVKESQHGDNM